MKYLPIVLSQLLSFYILVSCSLQIENGNPFPRFQRIRIESIKLLSNKRSRYHGNETHNKIGGSCKEYLRANKQTTCCPGRDDECYMKSFGTRCYCDEHCYQTKYEHQSDCCPDVIKQGFAICEEHPIDDEPQQDMFHGTQINMLRGGTCKEFLEKNKRDFCCETRDDDCYIHHFDTRCYCDDFCDRSHLNEPGDCCPDVTRSDGNLCELKRLKNFTTTTKQITTTNNKKSCYNNGRVYSHGDRIDENCLKWYLV